jgi:hypothetical protein
MDNKISTMVKPDHQVLAPATELRDRPARNPALEAPGVGKTDDIPAPYQRSDNPPAGQQRLQHQPNCLDFRKLGHQERGPGFRESRIPVSGTRLIESWNPRIRFST